MDKLICIDNDVIEADGRTIKIKENIIIYFKTYQCAHCNTFEPIFIDVIKIHSDILFGLAHASSDRMDVLSMAFRNDIRSVPSLGFFMDGKFMSKLDGNILNFDIIDDFIKGIKDYISIFKKLDNYDIFSKFGHHNFSINQVKIVDYIIDKVRNDTVQDITAVLCSTQHNLPNEMVCEIIKK